MVHAVRYKDTICTSHVMIYVMIHVVWFTLYATRYTLHEVAHSGERERLVVVMVVGRWSEWQYIPKSKSKHCTADVADARMPQQQAALRRDGNASRTAPRTTTTFLFVGRLMPALSAAAVRHLRCSWRRDSPYCLHAGAMAMPATTTTARENAHELISLAGQAKPSPGSERSPNPKRFERQQAETIFTHLGCNRQWLTAAPCPCLPPPRLGGSTTPAACPSTGSDSRSRHETVLGSPRAAGNRRLPPCPQ